MQSTAVCDVHVFAAGPSEETPFSSLSGGLQPGD